MAGNIYPTICPGCNFGCGLYIRENEGLDVEFRKSSPANAGKLCRFGMKLLELYRSASSMVGGKETSLEDAAKEAAKRLSGGSAALVSFGNTTCEEHLAFRDLAEKLGAPFYTGVDLEDFPEDTRPTLKVGIPYNEIEKAKHIVLFIDPYIQYPLIVRRLVSAKNNGARITSIGWKKLPLADEDLSPGDVSKLELSKDSIVIADLHPLSDIEYVKNLLGLAKKAGARITFLKPFANSTGAGILSEGQSTGKLVEEIEKGSIKTLFCLESDITEVIPEDTLSKLENLIVQTGRESATTGKADIVIAHEPLYRKKGELVNNEGRVQALGGEGTGGLEALGIIAGSKFEFDALQEKVKKAIGIETIDEFTIPDHERPDYAAPEGKPAVPEEKTALVSMFNPFMWYGLPDDNNFVELNLKMVRSLKLIKGGTIKIKSNGSAIDMRFRVAPVQDNILISEKRVPFVKGIVTPVEVSR